MAWTTPRTYVAGEVVTAAILNTDHRDNLNYLYSSGPGGLGYTTYTPNFQAVSVNPAIGNGTITGRYTQVGKLVHGSIGITMGSTTTYGTGAFLFSFPVTGQASITGTPVAVAVATDTGVNTYAGTGYAWSTTLIEVLTDVAPALGWDATHPFTFGNTDTITVAFTYEAA